MSEDIDAVLEEVLVDDDGDERRDWWPYTAAAVWTTGCRCWTSCPAA
jgi:hypothetical protein